MVSINTSPHKFNRFDIPGLYYFEAGNYFTGSRCDERPHYENPDNTELRKDYYSGLLNFRIESDGKEMMVKIWYGILCSELAEIKETKTFPVTEEGHKNMMDWLEELYQNSRQIIWIF